MILPVDEKETEVDVFDGTFETLAEAECWELLRTQNVGRVAWSGEDGVQVLPVNYVLDDDRVVFRTIGGGALASLASGRRVAFQIDDIDTETQTGWAVLAQGASGVPQPHDGPDPQPWVDDHRDLWIALTITEVSGRLVEK
ncbi:pyridoxamine 5'-phosphate oxidase family protein [Enemella sp. A6]|uniref:pyridoxamine 5'-phosphate oxidase family protein n=1 Tax=Enemella sp. A6 TaxID=3440152 RepID=UPI003EBDF09B